MSIETPKEFCARQSSGKDDAVRADNLLLFANGAAYEDAPFEGGGARYEPPTDPMTLARNKHQYWKVKVSRAEADFKQLHSRLMEHVNVELTRGGLGPPTKSQIDQLTELRQRVDFMRAEYDKAKTAWDAVNPRHLSAEADKRNRADRERELSKVKEQLRNLSI